MVRPALGRRIPIDHYQVLRGIAGWEPSFFRDSQGTSFVDQNVSAGESYVYAVRAVTDFGSGMASDLVQVNVTTVWGAPDAIGVCSVDQADDHISLTWTIPYSYDNPIIVYHVYRGISSDGSDRIEIGQPTSPSYVDNDVVKGQTYYYWVVAENGFGMGGMSALTEATAITNGGLGDLSWLPLVAALAFIIIVAFIVLVILRGARTKSRASKTPPMTHPVFQPQANQGRCPSCGASVEGNAILRQLRTKGALSLDTSFASHSCSLEIDINPSVLICIKVRAMNDNSRAYVLVTIQPGKEQEFANEIVSKKLINDPKVERVDFVHGNFDFVISLIGTAADIDSRILKIRLLPFVQRTETLIPFEMMNWERILKKIELDYQVQQS